MRFCFLFLFCFVFVLFLYFCFLFFVFCFCFLFFSFVFAFFFRSSLNTNMKIWLSYIFKKYKNHCLNTCSLNFVHTKYRQMHNKNKNKRTNKQNLLDNCTVDMIIQMKMVLLHKDMILAFSLLVSG